MDTVRRMTRMDQAATDSRGQVISRAKETLQVSLILSALLAVFFCKPILQGRKLLPADIAFNDAVYSGHVPAEHAVLHNILLYDQAYQFYPWRVFVSQAVRQRYLPFWNPYVYCGVPLLSEDQPAVFYPLNILSYALPPADATLFTAVARLFIAGLATYWFVRAIGGNRFGSLVSAVTFAFSGFMIVFLGHPHTNVAAWLPAFFLSVEWLVRKPDARNVAWVALAVACQLTGGHTETALYTLSAGGVYFLFRSISEAWQPRGWKLTARSWLLFGLAVALGFALAAVHVVPFWEWLQRSAEFRLRAGEQNLRSWRLGPKYWLAGLVPTLLPNAFGNPTWPGEYKSLLPAWNFVEQTVYVGVIGLALAATSIVMRRRDRWVRFFAVLAVVTLAAALRIPVFDWINHLPWFDIASVGRLRLIYTFSVSILAGLGGQTLFSRNQGDRSLRVLCRLLAGMVLVGVPVLWGVYRFVLGLAYQALKLPYGLATPAVVLQAYRGSNVALYYPLLVALAGCVLCRRWALPSRIMQVSLLLLLVVDLFAFGIDYHSTIRQENIYPDTPALQQLKNDRSLFRIVGTHVDFMPNTSILHGLYDIRGLDFPVHRYLELCEAMGGEDWLGYGILFTANLQPRLLDLLNVKYVLSSSPLGPEALNGMRVALVDQGITVYENLDCLPRAFVVQRVRVEEDQAAALQSLLDPAFDPGAEIVIEKAPPPGFVPSLQATTPATAEVASYEPNRVLVTAETPVPGFLFLSDAYYPDWKAFVDGVEAEIYQADYAFRAVYLEPGKHRVEFVYEPASFRLAVVVTLTALLAAIALATGLSKGPRRRRDLTADTHRRKRLAGTEATHQPFDAEVGDV